MLSTRKFCNAHVAAGRLAAPPKSCISALSRSGWRLNGGSGCARRSGRSDPERRFPRRPPVSSPIWYQIGLSRAFWGFAPEEKQPRRKTRTTRTERPTRMPLYEHTFLARQDVTQAQVEALMKEFQGVVEEGQGKITKQEYWGLKNLAFKIKKNRKAHYALLQYRRAASRRDRDGTAHGHQRRRHPLHDRSRRRTRDRAERPDAQAGSRRARRPR